MVGGLVVIPSGFYFGKSKPRPNLGKERPPLKPGVVEGVETPLAVALRVVGSLRSPFHTEMRSPS
jgi:hypothetical protein